MTEILRKEQILSNQSEEKRVCLLKRLIETMQLFLRDVRKLYLSQMNWSYSCQIRSNWRHLCNTSLRPVFLRHLSTKLFCKKCLVFFADRRKMMVIVFSLSLHCFEPENWAVVGTFVLKLSSQQNTFKECFINIIYNE